ncbi:MAG: OmpA family protein [Polyangiales bacterium]
MTGFALDRFDAPFGGDLSFVGEMPWYSGSRNFLLRAAITADYAYQPLVIRNSSNDVISRVVEHMLVGHLQVGVGLFDRFAVSLSLPISLYQSGDAMTAVSGQLRANGDVAVGDPRLSVRARLVGSAFEEAFSLHLGASLYLGGLGISDPSSNVTDGTIRVRVMATAAGSTSAIRWSATLGAHLRPDSATFGANSASPGVVIDHEGYLSGALQFLAVDRKLAIGPEFVIASPFSSFFTSSNTHAEVVLGARYQIGDWSIGAAAGPGLGLGGGTPTVRALAQIGYTPLEQRAHAAPPPSDRDHDGVLDVDDICPDEPMGAHPDPRRRGCPERDRDGDGVFDAEDICIDTPQGEHPDPQRAGCPRPDTDGDGVWDDEDQCVTTPAGPHPDPERRGCPDGDDDNDRVLNASDQCRTVPAGLSPDPDRPGCPLPDRDCDLIADVNDACPDQPGSPSTDRRRNGCPGLVSIHENRLWLARTVHFQTARAEVIPADVALLEALRDALLSVPNLTRLSIEGHTDDVDTEEYNQRLSDSRSEFVRNWLVSHGVAETRLEAHGFGETRPVVPIEGLNRAALRRARAQNRRVEFHIREISGSAVPAQPTSIGTPPVNPRNRGCAAPPTPPTPAPGR